MNASNVLILLCRDFPLEDATGQFSNTDLEMYHHLRGEILNFQDNETVNADRLIISEESEDEGYESNELSDDDFEPEHTPKTDPFPYDDDEMQDIVDLYDGKNGPRWKFETIQSKYKKLTCSRQIRRFRKYVSEEGSKRLKERQLDCALFYDFLDCSQKHHIICDIDLKRMALGIAEELAMQDFKASASFVYKFKKRHHIVSRKVTRRTVKCTAEDLAVQKERAETFKNEVRAVLKTVDHNKVFNTDQSGIQLELRGGRTLAFQGIKNVEALVQRISSTTHSLTIQPVITASGKLQLPMLVCFREPKPPKKFASEMEEFKYLKCVHSKCGMMTSALFIDWLNRVFIPNGGKESVLLLDSWTGYKKPMEESGREVEFMVIPEKMTGELQPLDIFFNRQFKAFLRRMIEVLMREKPDYIVSVRKNLARLLNITAMQISANRFRDMIRYAWHHAGFIDEHPPPFETPEHFCFNFDEGQHCMCSQMPVLRCAHCERFLCVKHFVDIEHTC
ncbi:hypothetical protein QR680_011886 [Steinernema hermaphroditum]|uniref:HTH CENPB-type domain-containing protein n=1 Tax=Steinernema hermaphroditum TaxID=289476 RepID=A0AA39I1X0_9BILA|nr:hypothetical protein QR680_011886 [Steinernema hermaphroditum]